MSVVHTLFSRSRGRAIAAVTLAVLAGAGTAQAALLNRGGGLIYDTVQDITWLADMNHAQTQFINSGGAIGTADGQMEWLAANIWANNLVYGGYTDWRLPTTTQPDPTCSVQNDAGGGDGVQSSGDGCVGSEMGHLFYNELGGEAGQGLLDSTGDTAQELANLAMFTNAMDGLYWSSTTYAPNSGFAWSFFTADGRQGAWNKDFQFNALAVRRGDSTSTVPEPSAAALSALALGLMAGLSRQRRRRAAPLPIGREPTNTGVRLMKTLASLASLALLASLFITAQPAAAATDRKVVSGLVCVAKDIADRDKLEYLARGLVALKEVTVLCPLLRDSTQSKLKSLRVNFQRGKSQTPFGLNPPGGSVPFRGLLYSCSSTEHVSAANEAVSCPFVSATSDPQRLTEDLDFINPALPMGEDQIFIFRVTLFPDTVLKSLIYTENN
jgi:hypothetical protein